MLQLVVLFVFSAPSCQRVRANSIAKPSASAEAIDHGRAKVLGILPALRTSRASYRMRRRTMRASGGVSIDLVRDAIEENQRARLRSSVKAGEQWWGWWRKKVEELRSQVSISDETHDFESQPDRFLRRHAAYLPNVDLTERPRADLFTSQHHLRIVHDRRFGTVCHLSHRVDVILQTPYSLLSPLPTAGHQISSLEDWVWGLGNSRIGEIDIYSCWKPGESGNNYDFWFHRGKHLPAGVMLVAGESGIGAVYGWRLSDGFVWACSIGKVRWDAGSITVDWIEIESFQLCPQDHRVKLRTDLPVKLLDYRFGAAKYKPFRYDELPQDVRRAYDIK